MSDLLDRLREKHNDTWPIQIGHGEPVNRDGEEAAAEIERLRNELASLYDGRTAVLPKTRKHALDLLTVAEACLNNASG